jgi:glutamate-ammonia-ligase adenylyltransferase
MTGDTGPLFERMAVCGPVIASDPAARAHAHLSQAAAEAGWTPVLEAAWPALAPVFSASPYLAFLARRSPERLRRTLEADPADRLGWVLTETDALSGDADAMRAPLRGLKADLHLLTALSDLGGVWGLDPVTAALSTFADAATRAALRGVAQTTRDRGRLMAPEGERGPLPGLIGLAMGKHGANELNYSSDIDLSLFYEPDILEAALAPGVEAQRFVDRFAQGVAALLSERTADGYVFRVDLRLRPDPSSTPPVVAAPAALAYYESVGQNWERAAFIKARPVCGDLIAAGEFLMALRPFIWRRSLDYQAIADVHSIKRQIHAYKTGEGMQAAGANLKLGRGGIREIEFFVQTQQLILGGRDPSLRTPRTLEALQALSAAGHLDPAVAAELSEAYVRLRDLEHRVQMLDDEQTHALPADPALRRAVAALTGEGDLDVFDGAVTALLTSVNARYADLFADEEALSSPYGSLVFTGVDNDPETLATLERMGFDHPDQVAETIRSWHHGRINATRTARGRELFTRLAPRLLTALALTEAPNAAFTRFSVFFSRLSGGVQVQTLFLARPELFDLVVKVMAFAPRLAAMLGRYPAALDSILDSRFQRDLDEDSGVIAEMRAEAASEADFETAMNAVRRIHRDQIFRIGMQTITERATPESAGHAYADLAEASLRPLCDAALRETARQAGAMEGGVVVVALGKLGSREMTAGSDLDLMTIYEVADPAAMSEKRGWSADVFYGRFTQRLIAALSAHTAEGGLYEVDMRLRPSGSAGPVAVSLEGFSDYYEREAATWEFMALTRARIVWASDADLAERAGAAITRLLRRPRDVETLAHDVAEMRALMDRERKAGGFWDLKLSPGAQVDCEFAAQFLQLRGAPEGAPLAPSTLEALEINNADPVLGQSWRMHQALAQVLKCAFDGDVDPEHEPTRFRARLARAAGVSDYETLKADMADLRTRARAAFEALMTASDGKALAPR